MSNIHLSHRKFLMILKYKNFKLQLRSKYIWSVANEKVQRMVQDSFPGTHDVIER